MKIAMVVPSRARPKGLQRYVDSVANTQSGNHDVKVFAWVDNDDPKLIDYQQMSHQLLDITFGDSNSVQQSWDHIAQKAVSEDHDIVIMGNDDLFMVTPNWDQTLTERVSQYPDNIYVAWFNEGIMGNKLSAFPVVSSDWIKTLGWFMPHYFTFGMGPKTVFEIAKSLNRLVYISEVKMTHEHHSVTGHRDSTTNNIKGYSRNAVWAKDKQTYSTKDAHRAECVEKLRKVIHENV